MRVTVWRHGEAGAAPRDEGRPLTDRGRRSLASAAKSFSDSDTALLPTRIHYSPLLRTEQTAGIIAQQFPSATRQVCPALAPGANLHDPQSFLLEQDAEDTSAHIILVTHQPFVSELIWYWLDDFKVPPITPGGFCVMELMAPTRGGALLLQAVPDVLGRFYE
jgi:phosphohistidine phosphatase SixA